MNIRPVEKSDRSDWIRLRYALWPEATPSHEEEVDRFFRGESKEPEAVLVAEVDGELKGFAEFSIRFQAAGCTTDHIAYLEGWYVEPDVRGRGLGRALVEAGEVWARGKGCVEFASDCELDNELSAKIHKILGFEEVVQIRCFRKPL
jgi:aminoglycoside 6'-N-acetyltransferase I